MNLVEELKKILEGDVVSDSKKLDEYSRDASVCKIFPKVIVFPKNVSDIKKVVNFVRTNRLKDHSLAITTRGAGTDMSGASIGSSIILDTTKYINGIIGFQGKAVTVLPGTFYRDFEKEASKRGLLLPSYPASKLLCTLGGMVANNTAGERTLVFGQTAKYVKSLRMVCMDGEEYLFKPISKSELEKKMAEDSFEGHLYKKLFNLIESNKEEIDRSKPKTLKNASGYYLWNVWQGEVFDPIQVIVGSQGTFGVITEITFELVDDIKYTSLVKVPLKDLKRVPEVLSCVIKEGPSSIESYDDETVRLSIKYLPDILERHTSSLFSKVRFFFTFLPEIFLYYFYGFPRLTMIIEFGGIDKREVLNRVRSAENNLKAKNFIYKSVTSEIEKKKMWAIRRESYNLLRSHSFGKEIATFIEDVVVPPSTLFDFLPKINDILHSYDLRYSIAGHAGSGNFHIFPLMDFKDPSHKDRIIEISKKVYELVASCGGSITAEHNDGISRTPFLHYIFSEKMLNLFVGVKNIFDVQGIFNPNKKTFVSEEYFKNAIR